MTKPVLSKSTYIRSLQCVKSLYLHKKRPFLRDRLSKEQRAKFERGTDIGLLARDLYPGGIDCSQKSPMQYARALELTAASIAEGHPVLYEAAFMHDGILIYLDILLRDGDAWKAIEVKSSASLSQTYFEDAALQYYVLNGAGIDVSSFWLMHVNTDYELEQEPDLAAYFRLVDVIAEVMQMQESVLKNIAAAKSALQADSSPKIDIGSHCHLPYPCDFQGHCWKKVASPNVFDIPGLSWGERDSLYLESGIDLEAALLRPDLDPGLMGRMQALVAGEIYRNEAILAPLKTLRKDILLIDIAYGLPAKPLLPGTKPYAPFPFAAALTGPGGEMYILDLQSPDQAIRESINFLSKHILQGSEIIVWDAAQEQILRNLLPQNLLMDIHILDEFYGTGFFYPGEPLAKDLRDLAEAARFPDLESYSRILDSHRYSMHFQGKGKDDWHPEKLSGHCRSNLLILRQLLDDICT